MLANAGIKGRFQFPFIVYGETQLTTQWQNLAVMRWSDAKNSRLAFHEHEKKLGKPRLWATSLARLEGITIAHEKILPIASSFWNWFERLLP
jgi:hypothetical protein